MPTIVHRLSRRIRRSLRTRGVWGSLRHTLRTLLARLTAPRAAAGHATDDDFDQRYGVDTGGVIPQADLDVERDSWVHGSAYVATSPVDFAEVLAPFALTPERSSFVDLGCGKGRVLLMAAGLPFARIIGVEYSPALSEIARANLDRYRGPRRARRLEVQTGDAGDYTFPDGDLVVFMYHPFDEVVMARVVARLSASLRAAPRRALVLYFKPVHASLWLQAERFTPRHRSGLYDVYEHRADAAP
ncbi:MAG: class I SAM-dependent methyltransferase [Xanthomonadales bacterium]|nr:class I SAM-dependent methyltransferase [Xanthomonadales bacterium]